MNQNSLERSVWASHCKVSWFLSTHLTWTIGIITIQSIQFIQQSSSIFINHLTFRIGMAGMVRSNQAGRALANS